MGLTHAHVLVHAIRHEQQREIALHGVERDAGKRHDFRVSFNLEYNRTVARKGVLPGRN